MPSNITHSTDGPSSPSSPSQFMKASSLRQSAELLAKQQIDSSISSQVESSELVFGQEAAGSSSQSSPYIRNLQGRPLPLRHRDHPMLQFRYRPRWRRRWR